MGNIKPTYAALKRQLKAANQELELLRKMTDDLQKLVDQLAKLQPPPPLVFSISADEAKRLYDITKSWQRPAENAAAHCTPGEGEVED